MADIVPFIYDDWLSPLDTSKRDKQLRELRGKAKIHEWNPFGAEYGDLPPDFNTIHPKELPLNRPEEELAAILRGLNFG